MLQVKPTQFGVVDNHTLFVAFEGRATEHTPLFKVGRCGVTGPPCPRRVAAQGRAADHTAHAAHGAHGVPHCAVLRLLCCAVLCCACCAVQGVDLFYFNDTATKIKEVQGE